MKGFSGEDCFAFERWWKNFGRYEYIVLKNPSVPEEDFKKMCEEAYWLGAGREGYDEGHSDGWDACEKHYNIKEE